MPVTVDRKEAGWVIRVEGEFTLTSAAELKTLLVEGLASAKELQLDLRGASEIGVPLLQLLWAAGREAIRQGAGMACHSAEPHFWRKAGFEALPGICDSSLNGGGGG